MNVAQDSELAKTAGSTPLSPECAEIKAAIKFYEDRGQDWFPVVAFLSAKAWGIWPPEPRYPVKRKSVS